MLKAGTAIADITPPEGLPLVGYPHYSRNNTGAHDPLYAACMYLSDSGKEFAYVTLDLCGYSKAHVAEARKRAEAACGIRPESLMICCSHTHSGPRASGFSDLESILAGEKQPMEYINCITDKIVGIIKEAKENAFEAEFASGTAMCGAESGVGGNRRVPGGPHDPLVSVMAVRNKEKEIKGIFVNYTLHPTFIHEWSTVCTADYPAYLRIQLNEYEKDAVIGFSQGASGNQSSRYYRKGESFDEAERVGRTLGKAAYSIIPELLWKDSLEIAIEDEELEVELRPVGEEDDIRRRLERDRAIYQDLYARYGKSTNRNEYLLWQNANLKVLGEESELNRALLRSRGLVNERIDDEVPDEIQLVRLGDTLVVGVQGEIFVEYALYVKAMAGFPTVVFTELANGSLPGYLYTPESLCTGGYEVGTSSLDVDFGRHMVDKILDMAKKFR